MKYRIFVRLSRKSMFFKFYEISQVWIFTKIGTVAVAVFHIDRPGTDGRTYGHDVADLRMHLATKHSWGETCLYFRHGCKLRLSPPWDQVVWAQFLTVNDSHKEGSSPLGTLKIVAPCFRGRALCPACPYVHCIVNICLARIPLVPDVRSKLISDS